MLIVGVLVYNDILFMPLARKYLLSMQETVIVQESSTEENEPFLESDEDKNN